MRMVGRLRRKMCGRGQSSRRVSVDHVPCFSTTSKTAKLSTIVFERYNLQCMQRLAWFQ